MNNTQDELIFCYFVNHGKTFSVPTNPYKTNLFIF